jgi:hypothetical protein
MSLKDSLPGTSGGVAKSAIKTVTANRNPNRTPTEARPQEEIDTEKKEANEALRADFHETVAREFASKNNSFKQFQKNQQQNPLAMLAGMNNNTGAAMPPMPNLPNIPNSKGSGNSNSSSPKAPQSQEIKKPDLINNKTESPRISPLQTPGQSNNSSSDQNLEEPRSQDNSKRSEDIARLPQYISLDADRVAPLRGLSPGESRAQSQIVLNSYKNNNDKHSLNPSEVRRLVAHGIPFNENYFNPKNSDTENDKQINGLISAHNLAGLSKLGQANQIAQHYKELGFSKGDYSQLTAKQFKESFDDTKQAKADREAFMAGPKNQEAIAKENSRTDKQALILLPEKDATEFDMTREVADLKKLGFTPVFAQIDNENGLKLYNDDGSKTPIKKLADDVGGFGLVVMGGHGQNSKTPAIRFGDKPDSSNIKKSEQLAQAEKAYLDKTDFEDDKGIKAFFQDRSILKEGGTLASCSCSFTGSSDTRENYIKPEESLAKIFEELRPDADVFGAFDEVHVHGEFKLADDGRLEHTTMRRLDEPELSEDQLVASRSEVETTDIDSLLASLDIGFDDDY